MGPVTIEAKEYPIKDVFNDKFIFEIPSYQRPYAWTTTQAGELFDDLSDYLENIPVNGEQKPPYFLGSIVLIKATDLPSAQVVDGQQRLTTLTILLAAIRERLTADYASS